MIKLLEALMEADKKEQYFEERMNKHIALVQKNIEKIASEEWDEFDVSKLKELGEVHDASKFVEPERTPYIELVWWKKRQGKDMQWREDGSVEEPSPEMKEKIRQATLYHVLNNSHHPEYWLEDKSEANINAEDRDKSDWVIDATRMPPLAIAEMVADWQAMSEEMGTFARDWYMKTREKRWHWSKEQEELIDRLLRVFEDERIGFLIDKDIVTNRPIEYVSFILPVGMKGKVLDHDGGLLTVKFENGKTLAVHPIEVDVAA